MVRHECVLCARVAAVELYPVLSQNSFSFSLLPSLSSAMPFFFFAGSHVCLLAGEPTTPTQSWPGYRHGLERWA